MKTIWKFPLKIEDNFTIEMPYNSEILCVQTQNEEPQIWALVSTTDMIINKTFEVFGTGHNIPDGNRKYIGTFQMDQGALVFHVFEKL